LLLQRLIWKNKADYERCFPPYRTLNLKYKFLKYYFRNNSGNK
jgi:hypothetical protein